MRKDGLSALMSAVFFGPKELVPVLIDAGADLETMAPWLHRRLINKLIKESKKRLAENVKDTDND